MVERIMAGPVGRLRSSVAGGIEGMRCAIQVDAPISIPRDLVKVALYADRFLPIAGVSSARRQP